ncbi:unnamed protein product [Mytilus coruscus]|uniref:Uncharacterized protein n=1 Tax=Mytilus coruscus TaxID=42192 RepID=A0A6J8D6H3_MYTCO|nr:unnamed protein product [Mytilus coruscus]
MNKQIEELLKYDIIEESNSEWGAPVVMCRKTTGQLRFCCDFRSLNQVSATHFFPLPRLEDVFDSIGKSKAQVFSTLDLFSGYWQCGLDPSTAHKSAFVTPSGVYQWKRRPFGIASAPASFQHMLTHVLHGLNYQMALVYVDDILVFSRNFEEHMKNLQLVFDRLLSAGLTLKPSKCEFAQKEVLYLGHRISREGVKVDQSKVEAVKSFPVPKTETQVRSFLGLCNYYRKFIKNFAYIAKPLTNFTKKEVPFEWSEKCQKSFDKLKDALCSPPVLAYPDLSKPFILTTDASGTAIGYILGQFDSEGRERVCAYNGRSLSQSETKWSISEKECLAVLEGIKNYHVYLANSHFKIYTDHQALNWLSSIKQSTGRLARWYVLLQGYDYEICFRRGSKNTNADCLSRREYPHTDNNLPEPEDSIPSIDVNQISTSEPNNSEPVEITFFFTENPPIQRPILAAIDTPTEFNITTENIGDAQKDCPDFKDMYTYLSNDTLPEEKKRADKVKHDFQQYCLLDGVLYHFFQPRSRGVKHKDRFIKQLALPRKFRNDVLASYHNLGHFGFDRTYFAMQQKYFFPGMYQAVADYIKGCDMCQRAKQPAHAKRVPLTNMPIQDTFSRWHLDIIGPFQALTKESYRYILIIVDSFSKWTEAFPVRFKSAEEISRILHREIFSRYGTCHSLVTDRGQGFASKLVAAINQIYNVKHSFSSSYHPQTNSVAERTNKTIIQCMRTLVHENQLNWPELLPGILMAFRMTPSASLEFSPFYLVFGKEMNLPLDTNLIPKPDINKNLVHHIKNVLDNLKIARTLATENLKHAQEYQKIAL